MAKRELDVSDVSVTTVGRGATVHGVLTELSPVKISKTSDQSYYVGQITDGKKSLRLVSFDIKLKNVMDQAKDSNQPIVLNNCTIQESKRGYGVEIFANTQTKVYDSPKKFEISTSSLITANKTLNSLEEIKDLKLNEKVTVRGKVISLQDPITVFSKARNKDLHKQDFNIADKFDVVRGVVWEDSIGTLQCDQSYQITDVNVCQFGGSKYISVSATSQITVIDDLGEVIGNEGLVEISSGFKHITGDIIAVISFAEYPSCITCKSKVDKINDLLGKCTKCGMSLKWSRCTTSQAAKFIIEDAAGKTYTVTAFNDVLNQVFKVMISQ